MLLYFFLVLGTWGGALGKDVNCDEPEYRVCRLDANLTFPSTEADIDRMCPPYVEHLDCIQNYTESCGSMEEFKEDHLDDLTAVMKEACQKDSSLHLRIVENIGCFDEVLREDHEACSEYISKKIKPMHQHIQNQAQGGQDRSIYHSELWMAFQCLLQSLEFACIVSKSSERCGSEAAELALEVFSRTGITRRICAPSSEEKLAELLALLDLELGEEPALNRLIGRQ